MSKTVSFLYLSLTLGLFQDSSAGNTGSCSSARVEVSNLAAAPESTLARARGETSRIFLEARIRIEWQTFRVSKPVPGCPVRLIVSILPHATAFVSGMALGSSGGAVHAMVFWDRIEELAKESGSTEVILGHAMAHEIGHLLMGPAHFQIGLMRPRWDKGDIKRAARGRLQFTPAQAEALRGILARRAAQS